jgi:type III secretory pathway component EscV
MKKMNEVKGYMMECIMEGLSKKEKAMVIAALVLMQMGFIALYAIIIKVLFNIIF